MRPARGAWLLASAALACSPSSSHLGDLPSTRCGDPTALEVLDACLDRDLHEGELSFEPLHLLPGDFDGDGKIDLLSIGVTEGVVAERFDGGPRGPEGPPSASPLTGCSAYPNGGPLDADATDDVVFPSCEPSIDVFYGAADPTAPPVSVEVGLTVRSTVHADFELDGDVDLVVLGADAAGVPSTALLLGQTGGFAAPIVEPIGTLSFDPLGIHAGDLDGDTRIDLVIREGVSAPRIAVRVANGPATFEPWRALELPAVPRALLLADFGGEGAHGIAFADRDAGRVCVLPGIGPDDAATCLDLSALVPTSLAAADFDDDGGAELVVGDGANPRLAVLDRDDAGAWVQIGELEVPAPTDLVFLADVNGEGTLDVIAGHFAARGFSIRLGLP